MSDTFLKKYKAIEKIGEGSFSDVLKCQNRVSGELFAAKRLKKTFFNIKEILECPEVSTMRKITRHPNVLYVLECLYDSLSGRVTLIFELMDMSLFVMMKARKGQIIMEHKVKLYLHQLLKGLEHLHKHGIFHRDIKPENILIKGDSVKLADLGSIKGIYSKPPYTDYISTRWYRPPECLLTTGYYGPKMDIWASGCVFYELLTLKPLFPGSNELDQISKIHNILGTPHTRLVAKFRKQKLRNCFFFSSKKGQGLYSLVPQTSEAGKDLLRLMLIYDPEFRSNVRRLLDHRYFNELKEESPRITRSVTQASQKNSQNWRNPALMNHVLAQKRRKSKFSRILPNDSRRNASCEFIQPKVLNSNQWIPRIPQRNPLSHKTTSIKPEGAETKFPNIQNNGNMYENHNKMQKVASIKRNTLRMDYPNLRARRFNHYYEGETFRKINELSHNNIPPQEKLNHRPIASKPSGYQFLYRQQKNLRRNNMENNVRKVTEISGKRPSFNIKSPYVKSPAKKIAKREV
ncbi:MAPK/MAK/MRK overlapping kinase-like [Leptopilina heterotoma]|uniref:MAPK/MAK/MRK overlapping kinase-like n=1 Tax=Leptopilina heterotoma TaxID=63436 RepID=UPI001CA94EAC|nr:MAPK/MAK/MRK overlapping kinase-like [Leptopilina heterotoma]